MDIYHTGIHIKSISSDNYEKKVLSDFHDIVLKENLLSISSYYSVKHFWEKLLYRPQTIKNIFKAILLDLKQFYSVFLKYPKGHLKMHFKLLKKIKKSVGHFLK